MRLIPKFIFLCSQIWKNISSSKKKLFYIYILFSLLIAIIDFASIISLMNIVSYVTSDDIVSKEKINLFFDIREYSDKYLFFSLSVIFILITILSIFFRYFHGLINAKISHGVIYEFNQIIFKKLIYLNLLNNKNININTVTSNLSRIEDIRNVIIYGLTAISSILITLGILITLLFIDIKITFFSLLFFSTIYLLIILSIKKKMTESSKDISENIELKVNILSSLLNNMRNVIIDNLQFTFLKKFNQYDLKVTKARISLGVISFVPSIIIINSVFVILVGYLLFSVLSGHNFLTDVGKLVAIAYGAQKLNPLINSIYIAISRTGGSYYNIKSVLDFIKHIKTKAETGIDQELVQPKIKKPIISFKKTLKLEGICFKYKKNFKLIENLDLLISKNDKVVILGESGSGKSTILDILTGLVKPDKGSIKLDNIKIDKNNLKAYQKRISLITQNIFLEEGTMLKNITNTNKNSDIDFKRLKKCCEIAEIENFIKKNKEKYKMHITLNGTNLSGGQKQRIAIARALYKDSDILIFDETTSEIDVQIEKKILNNLSKKEYNKTIIFVTHKVRKINFFNKKFILIKKKLRKIR
jgi:ABC-type bacteriocin/lantibiotic exporter with double-glycine peptidase domain